MRRLQIAAVSAACLSTLFGCGGSAGTGLGGAGAGGSTGQVAQTATIGRATLKYLGKIASNVSSNTGVVSIVGAAGASFSEFNYLPASILANTTVLYTDSGTSVWSYNVGSGAQTQLLGTVQPISDYCFTHDGHILLCMNDRSTGYYQIYECYYDGSGLTRITSNAENHVSVSVNPTNTAILYSNGTSNQASLKTVNFSGGNVQNLFTGSYGKYSPSGTQIAYIQLQEPYVFSLATNNSIAINPILLQEGDYTAAAVSWSPDSLDVGYALNTGYIYITDFSGAQQTTISVGGGAGYDSTPTFAPDGRTICFPRAISASTPSSLVISGYDGYNASGLVYESGGYSLTNPVWSPYPGPRAFVGSGGTMFTSASGFLWSERASAFSGLVAFTATTPADATISAETANGSQSGAVFDLHADAITSLKYTNGYYVPAVSISPNVSDCLISFDATTGFITTAAPFIATKTAQKPGRKLSGSIATYTGKFAAIYDNKGKNLAPSGASQVSLDLKTGKLLSWQ